LQIKDWSELDKLAGLPELREVLFIGNPIYEGLDRQTAKLQVILVVLCCRQSLL
jgi:dynein light chain 1